MGASSYATLKAILDSTRAGTWVLDIETEEVLVNDRWAQMLGYELTELEPITFELWEKLSHPRDVEQAKSQLKDVISRQLATLDCVVRMMHKDGSWRFIHTRGTLTDGEEAHRVVGIHIDVTNEKKAQHQLTKLAESMPGMIYIFVMAADGSMRFDYISAKAGEFYGVAPEEAKNDATLIFASIHPEDLDRVNASIAHSYETLCDWSCDYRTRSHGRYTWVRGISTPERDEDGTVTWHGVVTNIDVQKQLEAEMERLAITDELTNAYNRRHMLSQLEAYLAEHTRYGIPFSLISIDIDHFKAVNDNYGHLVGDAVLKTFADIVSKRARKTDVFARVGGEEFLLLMPHTTLSNAANLAESIRETLESHKFETPAGKSFSITISAGVVGCSHQAIADVNELLYECDQSLYSAKSQGRNRLVLKTI